MTHFLNSVVFVGFTLACVAFVIDSFTLGAGGLTVAGIAALIDYVRN
jgi:hypothetical protein